MRNPLTIFTLLFTIQTAFSQVVLTDVSQSVGINHKAVKCNENMPAQGGAAWFDYDNDGWYDLYLTGGSAADALYRNNGNGTFTDKTTDAGISVIGNAFTNGATTGDFNKDGWNDLFVTTFMPEKNWLFVNNGDGTFSKDESWAGVLDSANSYSATFGDLNADGWLDLYVCNWSQYQQPSIIDGIISMDSQANFYYENNGDGSFIEKANALGIDDSLGCALGVIITDFDNDNDPDLFVSNDFGFLTGNTPNRMFRNDGSSTPFTEVSTSLGLDTEMNGMGVARTDINSDGRFDYYVTNILDDKLMVSTLTGFEDRLVNAGLHNDSVWLLSLTSEHWKTGWGVGFFDVDNDMDEDLMVANGSLFYDYPYPTLDSNKLFVNDGFGNFTDVSFEIGVADTYVSRALAYCDYDKDGDLDVFIGITDTVNGIDHSFLYRNDSPPLNWLQVKATGVQNNTNGIGAKAVVYVNGQSQMREIGGESSFNSQHWQVAHFGLGANQTIDTLQVIWYGGGVDRYYDLPVNQFIEVIEGQGLITEISEVDEMDIQVYPNPFSNELVVQGSSIQKVELFDVQGNLVSITSERNTGNVILDVSQLSAANYLLRIERSGGQIVIRKVVKK